MLSRVACHDEVRHNRGRGSVTVIMIDSNRDFTHGFNNSPDPIDETQRVELSEPGAEPLS